jgi:Ca2+ transporting ATPase
MCVFQEKDNDNLISSQEAREKYLKQEFKQHSNDIITNNLAKSSTINMNKLSGLNRAEESVHLDDLRDIMELNKSNEAPKKIQEKYQSVENLARQLNSNILTGISGSSEDLNIRIRTFGRNEVPKKKSKSILQLVFEALQDPTLVLLSVCAIVSIALSFYHPTEEAVSDELREINSKEETNLEWIEGVAILFAVAIVVFVTAFNDWRKEKQFRGLQERIESDNMSSVIRNGQMLQIQVKELVVGDICCIKYGDSVPADGLITDASDLKIDESSLTGETDMVKKNTSQNIVVFSGKIKIKEKQKYY